MARPKKNNADYFPHDADMRNDARIKAIRRKFGLEGYAIWCMMLEHLSDCDFFQYHESDLNMELLSGDFDIDPIRLKEMIDYFIDGLGLMQRNEGYIVCFRLEKGLEPLLSKRERDRSRVFDSENPQSKVKESKVKKSKEKESEDEPTPLDQINITPATGFNDPIKLAEFIKTKSPQMYEGSILLKFRHINIPDELEKFCNWMVGEGKADHSEINRYIAKLSNWMKRSGEFKSAGYGEPKTTTIDLSKYKK